MIQSILGNNKIIKILIYLINNQSIDNSQKEIIKHTNISKTTAVKWLKYLEKNNLVHHKKIGVTKLYKLNNNQIIKQFKILNRLISLEPLNKLNLEIYLYGSCARGEETEKSGIDLLIMGSIKRNQIINKIENLSKKLNKPINLSIFSQLEWSMMSKKDPAYYERVEKDKISL